MIFAKIILSARPDHRLQSQEPNSSPGSLILSPQGERLRGLKRERIGQSLLKKAGNFLQVWCNDIQTKFNAFQIDGPNANYIEVIL